MIRYCENCVLPETRPNLIIGEDGLCNACRNHETKKDIDWRSRESDFRTLIANAKAKNTGYDCLIPVSGGKDSTWQVVTCLEHGLNPLTVTWKTPGRTKIGQRNLDNLISLGVDHMDCRINPKTEKAFVYQALLQKGIPACPMHMAIFNIALSMAVRFSIPLVIWGENPAFEYGSGGEARTGFTMDSEWLKRFGVTDGTTAGDWVTDELTEKDLTPYFGPTDAELAEKNIMSIFLGYYFEWTPEHSYKIAREHGFTAAGTPRTGYYAYADIDDDFISVHHWLKWYKFGFTRLWDNLSVEIRNGRMSRNEAIRIIAERGEETPHGDIAKLCGFLDIPEDRFFEIIEPFRSNDIWSRHGGVWRIDGFLIPDWNWS